MAFLSKYLLCTISPFSSAVACANAAAVMELSMHGPLRVLVSSERWLQGFECSLLGQAGGCDTGFASTLPVPNYVHSPHQLQHSKHFSYCGKPHRRKQRARHHPTGAGGHCCLRKTALFRLQDWYAITLQLSLFKCSSTCGVPPKPSRLLMLLQPQPLMLPSTLGRAPGGQCQRDPTVLCGRTVVTLRRM